MYGWSATVNTINAKFWGDFNISLIDIINKFKVNVKAQLLSC